MDWGTFVLYYTVFMRKLYLSILVVFLVSGLSAQELPLGYILQYDVNFNQASMPKDIIFSKGSNGSIDKGYLMLSEKEDSLKGFYPNAAAIIDNHIFGEYIVNLKIYPKIKTADSTSSIFLLLGLRDSLNYYFVEMDQKSTRFCSMYKGSKTVHLSDSSLFLTSDKVATLIIKRNILDRSISIQKNGVSVEFSDPNLVMGYFGFGVSNSLLRLDELKIWAPTSIEVPAPVFKTENKI